MRLNQKIALITGGAAGIGKATVKRFAEEGAKVAFCDVNEELGLALLGEIGPEHDFQTVDVTNRQAVQDWVDSVAKKYERVDILVNNAGILRDGVLVKVKNGELVKQMAEEAFDSVIAVNLKGVFNCTQAVAPSMIKQAGGVILNASSIVGLDGNYGQTNYIATKAGVIGMTKVWARELGGSNIRVNAVAPGMILTEMLLSMPNDVLEAFKKRPPLKRLGTPEEVANLYLFLASDEASYISGEVIRIDGGLVIGT
ncbi:MAG: 3-oxoacyl-ACP reductase FabG [Anaerolineales bacterium]|uniref:3-oxoacyl-ACP reductase FabG n=1 Tax=Candidatus Desulfolinea nitratireducens TaxID=2841698 RepID=A0A8J6NI12_9CHLR|nr:3-oxoacyl-ACP reductase FabG [Candidatus Desulfolinea nitratireducens]MBL6961331.1 3-oxoacyl-ACP reductase FabG [Anaerolineales bacterium]